MPSRIRINATEFAYPNLPGNPNSTQPKSALGCDHFLLRHRHCIQEGLHRRFAEAPASLVRPRLIVFRDPAIQIGLQLVDRTIHLLAEGER